MERLCQLPSGLGSDEKEKGECVKVALHSVVRFLSNNLKNVIEKSCILECDLFIIM